jgi:hypothetical protein
MTIRFQTSIVTTAEGNVCGEGSIPELCLKHIVLDESKHTIQNKESVKQYKERYKVYLDIRKLIYLK